MTPPFIHATAVVDDGARIGAETRVWHFCHVMPGAVIGEGCTLGQNVVVMNGTKIGNNVKIQNNVSIYEGVELEDDVFCGPSMVFTNVVNPRSHVSRRAEFQRTLVRRGATIGANATIVCGVTIGEYAFVGAGAVVTRDVPPHALMIGVPARPAGFVCECGTTLEDGLLELACPACGKRYMRRGESVMRIGMLRTHQPEPLRRDRGRRGTGVDCRLRHHSGARARGRRATVRAGVHELRDHVTRGALGGDRYRDPERIAQCARRLGGTCRETRHQ
jgi:UDP-2-acetamido-3-amino-2,3-dideoxy-glucuronate N-acetyltransferase